MRNFRELKGLTAAEPWRASWAVNSVTQDLTSVVANGSAVQLPKAELDCLDAISLVAGSGSADVEITWQMLLVDFQNVMVSGGEPTVLDAVEWVSEALSRRTGADNDGGIYIHQGKDFHGLDLRRPYSASRNRVWLLSPVSTTQEGGNIYLIDYRSVPRLV